MLIKNAQISFIFGQNEKNTKPRTASRENLQTEAIQRAAKQRSAERF